MNVTDRMALWGMWVVFLWHILYIEITVRDILKELRKK